MGVCSAHNENKTTYMEYRIDEGIMLAIYGNWVLGANNDRVTGSNNKKNARKQGSKKALQEHTET
jgi:hypothetical protein